MGSEFTLLRDGIKLCDVALSVPGQHNARNAVAALAAALELDVDLGAALDALKEFTGVRRRFEVKGKLKKPDVLIVDDYGHHPTEIAATLAAARSYWTKGRIVVAFQPHRYSRTQICWDQFGQSLKDADKVYLLDIYAAGEPAIPGITSQELARKIGVDTSARSNRRARPSRARSRPATFFSRSAPATSRSLGPCSWDEQPAQPASTAPSSPPAEPERHVSGGRGRRVGPAGLRSGKPGATAGSLRRQADDQGDRRKVDDRPGARELPRPACHSADAR